MRVKCLFLVREETEELSLSASLTVKRRLLCNGFLAGVDAGRQVNVQQDEVVI